MNFLWIAVKDLLLIGRDKKAVLTLIIMPLLLISILGAAFGNMMNGDEKITIKKFTVGIVNLDKGPMGSILTDDVLAKGLSTQIRIKKFSENELYRKIKNRNFSVGMIIPANFTSSLSSGEETKVKLVSIPDPGVKVIIVQNVIKQFSQSITIEKVIGNLVQSSQSSAQANTPMIGLMNDKSQPDQTLLHETTINPKNKPVESFQYYAAAMGVMFLLMTVVQGVSGMILEKEQEVYKRLLVSNLTYPHYLIGKMLGLIIICLVQAFIIILGTRLLFGVHWGKSALGVSFVTIAYVISACGLGVLAGTILKTEKSFNVAGMIGTQIFAAIGGSMAPLYIFPDWVITVTKFLPNGLALQTYLKIMSGSSLSDVFLAVIGLLGLGMLFFTIGLIRLLMERRRKYA